jgi:RNA polymerase sigma-B factor
MSANTQRERAPERRAERRPKRARRPLVTPDCGSATERLVEAHLALAEKLASRYRHTSEPFDDLVQVARFGLLKAAQRWDPDRGVAFTSYAVPTIVGELRRHFRDHVWSVRPPRDVQELFLAVRRGREHLWQEIGREPSAQELATRLGRPLEDVLEALEAGHAYDATSLDVPAHADEADGATRQDFIVDPRSDLRSADERVAFEQLSAVLDDREREIIRLRFHEDLTQREIGERVGRSQMHISRLLRGALAKLRVAAETSQR